MKLNTETEFPMNHPQKAIEYPGTVLPIKKTYLIEGLSEFILTQFPRIHNGSKLN